MASTIPRAPLTSTEKTILKKLVKTLTSIESHFCCGGTIEIPSEHKFNLFYSLGSDKHASSLDMSAIESGDIEKLLEACVPAPHGRGATTVYDDSYRLARELRQGQFALTADIVNQSGVLDAIAKLTSARDSSTGKLTAHLDKLNSYAPGGFFKAHRDTPKSDRHVGTIVVALPIPFEGGALRVSHEGKDVLFDWGAAVSTTTDSDDVLLPWAFLFSDVEHEVLPVTSGTRITLAYNIFVSSSDPLSPQPMDGATLPFYSDLQAALKNSDFLPQGGKLGLALSHAYPVNMARDSSFFAKHLKGQDAVLHRVLLALNIPIGLRAVYTAEVDIDDSEFKSFPSDGFGPHIKGKYGGKRLFTSNTFKVIRDYQWDGGDAEFLQEVVNASLEPEIIWGRKPNSKTFSESGNYIAYGNEASLATVYVAAAFVLDIPEAGTGARTF